VKATFPKPFAATSSAGHRISDAQVKAWSAKMAEWLRANTNYGLADIKTGSDAWAVCSRSGVLREAYEDRSVVDAHIQTALEKIFPNAVFRDKKRY